MFHFILFTHHGKTVVFEDVIYHVNPIFKLFLIALKIKFKNSYDSLHSFLFCTSVLHSTDSSLSFVPYIEPLWTSSSLLNIPQYFDFIPFICYSSNWKYLLTNSHRSSLLFIWQIPDCSTHQEDFDKPQVKVPW